MEGRANGHRKVDGMTTKRLTAIANKFNCDKGTTAFEKHGYTDTYDRDIPSDGPVRLLEIGIDSGASLRMWLEYNPALSIVAIDNSPACSTVVNSPAVEIVIADQGSRIAWQSLLTDREPFDFIVDDGSHKMADQQVSLSQLLPHVRSGGVYYIEDLHTCCLFPIASRTDEKLRLWQQTGRFCSDVLSPAENDYISDEMLSVEFLHQCKMAKIIKR